MHAVHVVDEELDDHGAVAGRAGGVRTVAELRGLVIALAERLAASAREG